MKKYTIILSLLCMVLILTGCSSLPKEVAPQTIEMAHIKMKLAREAQGRQAYASALRLFADAYELFTRADHIRGKIDSGLSIARQYFYLDKKAEAETWIQKASDWIKWNAQEMLGAKAILLIEMAFSKDDHQTVVDIAKKTFTPNIEWETEILCYDAASRLKLKMDYSPDLQKILANLPLLEKRFEKNKLEDPEVLSLGYFYAGHILCTAEKKWREALVFFAKAKDVDSLIDNPYGVGKSLYSLGCCYMELGVEKEARSSFERALEIFTLLKDPVMVEKITGKIDSFSKKTD